MASGRKNAGRARKALLGLLLGLVLTPLGAELALQLAALARAGSRAGDIGAAAILCQGDSNTFGLYLPAESAYPAQLERILARRHPELGLRVVNRGLPGKPSWIVRSELPADLARHRPRVAILWAGINDRSGLRPAPSDASLGDASAGGASLGGAELARPAWEPRLLKLWRIWKLDRDEVRARERADTPGGDYLKAIDVHENADGTRTVDFADRSGRAAGFSFVPGLPPPEQYGPWIEDDWRRCAELARAAGAEPWFVLYPSTEAPFAPVNAAIARAAKTNRVRLIDARADFARAEARVPRSALLFPDGHPTALGYGILARVLANALEDAGFAPQGPPLDALEALGGWHVPELEVELDTSDADAPRLVARYAEGHALHALFASSSGQARVRPGAPGTLLVSPPGEHGKRVPLAADEVLHWSLGLCGNEPRTFDASGLCSFAIPALPPELAAASGRVWPAFACVLVEGPGQQALAVSEAIAIP